MKRDGRQSVSVSVANQVFHVSNVSALLELSSAQRTNGAIARMSGYRAEGDGGGKWVSYNEASTRADDGGIVHNPHSDPSVPGRWETVHNGVGDFRWFGILDAATPADDALEALINDPSIHRIEARSDLNFRRRHVFSRSQIELDFGGYTITTDGIELNTKDNPLGTVICFRGLESGETQVVTLSADLAEMTDILEVSDSSSFAVGDWWVARVSNRPGGGAQRELDYMVKVTELIDASHVRFNYKLGWTLEAGRTISYKKMNPVIRSHVRNMKFAGVPVPPSISTTARPFDTWDQIGSSPLAFEFAVECDVSDVRAEGVFWPVIMRRYCTHFFTERCELINPVERDWGGTGYLTQQISVLYGHVRDCNTSNSRHLNDFTCAAYCMVENCHGDGDDYGPFVTHGQFEHDLTYIGNSGLLSFANSGSTWGDSAKRISVKKHIASRIVAHKKLTDLTLEDCHAYYKEGLPDSGSILANVDGLQMRGCTAEGAITLSKSSSRSSRQNVIDSCGFTMIKGSEFARRPAEGASVGTLPVDDDLLILNSEIRNIEQIAIGSIRKLTLLNSWLIGASPESGNIEVACRELVIQGGGMINCGLVLTGAWDRFSGDSETASSVTDKAQSLTIDGGAVFRGVNGARAFLIHTDPEQTVKWNFGNMSSSAEASDMAHFVIRGGCNQYKAVGSTFTGGRFDAASSAFGSGSYMLHGSCVEQGVDRSALPAQSAFVRHTESNLILP